MINHALGALKPKYDCRDWSLVCGASDFPKSFRCSNLPPIKDQGQTPACVAYVGAELVEWHYRRQHSSFERFSTEFVYGYRPNGYTQRDGMLLRDALKTLKEVGNVTYDDLPGNNLYKVAAVQVNANLGALKTLAKPHVITTYFQCKDAAAIKKALMTYGPVMASMGIWKGDKVVKGDYISNQSTEQKGAHCVLIVGWKNDKWVVMNSWGKNWGDKGFFYLPIDFKWYECWGISDTFVESDIHKPILSNTKILYKIVNFIIKIGKKLKGGV